MNLAQRSLEKGQEVIELEGEADLAAAPEFQSAVREVMKRKADCLVIDFSKATFVNTPIWAVVVEYFQHATKEGSSFAVTGLNGRVEASFNIVRLGEFIQHYATVEEAVAAVKQ